MNLNTELSIAAVTCSNNTSNSHTRMSRARPTFRRIRPRRLRRKHIRRLGSRVHGNITALIFTALLLAEQMRNGLLDPVPAFPLRVSRCRCRTGLPGNILEIRTGLATLPDPAAVCSSLHITRYIGHHRFVLLRVHNFARLGAVEEASKEERQVPATSSIYSTIIAHGGTGLDAGQCWGEFLTEKEE